jgi:mannonate dehydratase
MQDYQERPDLHRRLVHGSDYPVAGINLAVRTSRLADEGFIAPEDRAPLNEIYRRDPLLFDLVVLRTVRHPATGRRFDACVFRVPPEIR